MVFIYSEVEPIKTTRQRILEYLAAHHGATAAELSAALQVTPADVRHHLSNLRDEGVVIPAAGSPLPNIRQGRGRPARRYRLPEPVLDSGLSQLLSALLAETYDALPLPEQEAFLHRLAARLAGPPIAALGLSQRLVVAVQRLNQLGYQARWEARASGPRLILEQRPFTSLETSLPALAKLETYLLEQLLGTPLSRIEVIRLVINPQRSNF